MKVVFFKSTLGSTHREASIGEVRKFGNYFYKKVSKDKWVKLTDKKDKVQNIEKEKPKEKEEQQKTPEIGNKVRIKADERSNLGRGVVATIVDFINEGNKKIARLKDDVGRYWKAPVPALEFAKSNNFLIKSSFIEKMINRKYDDNLFFKRLDVFSDGYTTLKSFPIGTIHDYKGMRFQKIGEGDWRKIGKSNKKQKSDFDTRDKVIAEEIKEKLYGYNIRQLEDGGILNQEINSELDVNALNESQNPFTIFSIIVDKNGKKKYRINYKVLANEIMNVLKKYKVPESQISMAY